MFQQRERLVGGDVSQWWRGMRQEGARLGMLGAVFSRWGSSSARTSPGTDQSLALPPTRPSQGPPAFGAHRSSIFFHSAPSPSARNTHRQPSFLAGSGLWTHRTTPFSASFFEKCLSLQLSHSTAVFRHRARTHVCLPAVRGAAPAPGAQRREVSQVPSRSPLVWQNIANAHTDLYRHPIFSRTLQQMQPSTPRLNSPSHRRITHTFTFW